MRPDNARQELYEALEELRLQTCETLRSMEHNSVEDAVNDVTDGELATKMKLVAEAGQTLLESMGEEEVRQQNRLDGYGCI